MIATSELGYFLIICLASSKPLVKSIACLLDCAGYGYQVNQLCLKAPSTASNPRELAFLDTRLKSKIYSGGKGLYYIQHMEHQVNQLCLKAPSTASRALS